MALIREPRPPVLVLRIVSRELKRKMMILLVINSVLTKMIWLNTGSVEERMVMMKVSDLRLLSD